MKVLQRTAMFVYGLLSYAVFLATALYAIGFIGGFLVPTTLDGEPRVPFLDALLIDTLLLALFAVQHSVMARPAFKRMWTRVVPEPIERSTYVLFSSAALILLYWQWRPMTDLVWDVDNEIARNAIWAAFALGWLLVLISTFLINHFDLFGLRQVYLYLRETRYTELPFQIASFYKVVRHPLLLGFIIAFWAAPTMTVGHLLFTLATTAYMLVAIQFEERDMVRFHGQAYVEYRQRVRMIVPLPK